MTARPLPFAVPYPVVGVVHVQALPGAPGFGGSMQPVLDDALRTIDIFHAAGVDGVIVENFHDAPFFVDRVPAETIAALSAVAARVVDATDLPVGINVLRNDGAGALAVAAATGAAFVRINVLGRPVVSEQGVITGRAAEVLRLREQLAPQVAIWADAAVKHAAPMVPVALDVEIHELTERCGADVIVVSGDRTGLPTDPMMVKEARAATQRPVFVGSGATIETLASLSAATGLIVGTAFEDHVGGAVQPERVAAFMDAVRTLRAAGDAGDR
jgi:membrane complex biogenesis BtpA family protein